MIKRIIIVCLVVMSLGQLGQGGYLMIKAALAQWLLERSWQALQAGDVTSKPWPWADTTPLVKLDFFELNRRLIVLKGASGRNLAFAPTHLSSSAMPGQVGVSVIGGHRDTHFKFLEELILNDRFRVESPDGHVETFRVSKIDIVNSAVTSIALETEQPVILLVTCYPFDALQAGGPLRYVVTAEQDSVPAYL